MCVCVCVCENYLFSIKDFLLLNFNNKRNDQNNLLKIYLKINALNDFKSSIKKLSLHLDSLIFLIMFPHGDIGWNLSFKQNLNSAKKLLLLSSCFQAAKKMFSCIILWKINTAVYHSSFNDN